jgi:hypothetical protein
VNDESLLVRGADVQRLHLLCESVEKKLQSDWRLLFAGSAGQADWLLLLPADAYARGNVTQVRVINVLFDSIFSSQ